MATDSARLSLAQVNRLSQAGFTDRFGGVYEHASWIAEKAWSARPFGSFHDLHEAMVTVMRDAPAGMQLDLMCAHPELAPPAQRPTDLADFSRREQAGAGLDALSPDESERLRTLNGGYRDKFGFPCIIAVKGLARHDILNKMAMRLERDRDTEYEENLTQIAGIARHRLAALVGPD